MSNPARGQAIRPGGVPGPGRGGPSAAFADDERLVVLSHPRSTGAERYRRLCSRLEIPAVPSGPVPRVVLVTSAVPGEGKTTTAVNLALALAEDRDKRVLLVDADLRRPAVGRLLRPEPEAGLADVLAGTYPLDRAALATAPGGVTVLPAGAAVGNPLERLRTADLPGLFAALRARWDTVVVDTPPCVPFADASVVHPHTDGALLVVRSRTTSRPLVEKAREALSGGPVLGAVLNALELTLVDRYYYRYDEYDPYGYVKKEDDGEASR